jgi:Holliday junction resolvasome RuvABC DNA-binding subunit
VIAHLTGTLHEKQLQRLIVDVGGVGYDVLVPLSTMYAIGDRAAAWRCVSTPTFARCASVVRLRDS